MTFTSFQFLLFFPLIVVLYQFIPKKIVSAYLLVVSYVFYAFMQPLFLLLLAAVTLVTYLFARWMGSTDDDDIKHRRMWIGVICVVLPLVFYKYFAFLAGLITDALTACGIVCTLHLPTFVLPVGISFFTFMAISYLVDLYNETVEEERNITHVALFLSFFPIILSGPIERAGNMIPQFKNLQPATSADLVKGAKIMLWGYFMKLCVADRLGTFIDPIYTNMEHHNGTSVLVASLLYPIQEYCDFAGYSLLAIGVARCLGLKVMDNFNRPFFSRSMGEFWRRWHISLIKWLKDYVYTPLSINLLGWKKWGAMIALLVTFLFAGVWHEASVAYIAWGIFQGLIMCFELLTRDGRNNLDKKFGKYFLYNFIWIAIIYVLFAVSEMMTHCPSFNDFGYAMTKICTEGGKMFNMGLNFWFIPMMMGILIVKEICDECFPGKIRLFESKYVVVRFATYLALAFIILLCGVVDGSQFIYFQF